MPISYTIIVSFIYLAFGVFLFLLGLAILRTGGSSPTTRSTALMLFFCGLGPILSATNTILISSLREGSVVYTSMVENFEYLWEFFFPSLLLFSLTFPRENRFIRRFGFLALLLFVPHIVHLFTIILADNSSGYISSIYDGLTDRTEISGERGKLAFAGIGNITAVLAALLIRAHRQLFSLVNIVYAVLAITFLARNVGLIISPRIYRQLKTVLIGLMVSVVTYAFTKLTPIATSRELPQNVNLGLINFSLIAGGGTIAYAVVRQQFLGIRFIVRKSILYGGMSLVFALLYLTVVKPISVFFGNYSVAGQEAFETGFIILSIIAFQPVLTRVEELLEQFLMRGTDDTRALFKILGSELRNTTTLEDLEKKLKYGLDTILGVSSTKLTFCEAHQQDDFHVKLLAEIGDPVTAQDLIKLQKKALDKQDGTPASESAGDTGNAISELVEQHDVLVPVVSDKKCLVILALAKKSYGMRYSTEEMSLLSLLSSEIGLAIENIRLLRESVERGVMEEEMKLARSIQLKLLPAGPPALRHFDLHAVTLPSRQVGGDFYDFALLDERTLVIVVADVSGKGVPASLLVATLHAALKSNEDVQRSPGEMMARINRLLFRSTSTEQFATLFYGVVDIESGNVRYANAGHDFPIVLNGTGSHRLEQSGIVLGLLEGFQYDEHAFDIPETGGLVLYTDGLTEASAADIFFGEERLERLLRQHSSESAEQVCRAVLSEVSSFAGENETQDDLTLLVLKRKRLTQNI
jgi:serine phosphatase RsbU (regulator of sigma subunit)